VSTLLNRLVVLPFLRLCNQLAADTACRAGAGLGIIAWHLGVRRRVAQQMISETLGLRGPQRRAALKRSYATMGANFLELLTVGGPDGPERHQRYADPAWVAHLYRRHRGCVFVTPHLGNWDMGASCHRRFAPRFVAYAKAQHNAEVDAYINALRQRAGIEVLLAMRGERKSALVAMRAIRDGVPLGLMADQRPWAEHGVPGYFLGIPTPCLPGSGFFAERCQVPLIPGCGIRIRAGVTMLFVGRPVLPCGDETQTMQAGLDRLSAMIAAFPGQYFWQHNRFRTRLDLPPRAQEPWRIHGFRLLNQG
jgi:KDO2-lipid IV(A) lauroyltransferase